MHQLAFWRRFHVRVAARVEQLSKDRGTDTLITEETLIRLPDALRRQAVPHGEHPIRGRAHTVTVYAIAAAGSAPS